MSGDVVEQVLIKNSDTSIGEIWNMFNLNKRMCAAEEGIKKLAIILQDILNKCSRTEDIFDSEDSNY